MRDLLTLLDTITTKPLNESRGIGARKPGDPFVNVNDENDTASIDSVDFYPGPTEDVTIQKLQAICTQVTDKMMKDGIALVSIKPSFTNNSKAFGVAVLKRSNGSKIAFIKPFSEVKPDPAMYAWDNQTGLEGYRFSSKAANKSTMKIQASDILSNLDNITPQDILKDITAKYGRGHTLTKVAAHIASGANLPVSFPKADDIPFEAFRDYFLEMLQPVALINGQFGGTAKSLNGGDFSGYNISFNKEKNGGLSDSLLVNTGGSGPGTIRVSSKGALGANAAASNLVKVAMDLKDNAPQVAKKHGKVIDLLERMIQAGQWESPLLLGLEYGLINEKDAQKVRDLKKAAPIAVGNFKSIVTPELFELVTKERISKLQPQIEVLPYTTCTAAVAHAVARHINMNSDFSKAACDILNYGLLVQVYSKVRETGKTWTVDLFDAKYPSTETTRVWFDAGKNYMNTQCKGNFCFQIEKNSNKAPAYDDDQDSEPTQSAAEVDQDTDDQVDQAVNGHVDIRPPGTRALKTVPSAPRELKAGVKKK